MTHVGDMRLQEHDECQRDYAPCEGSKVVRGSIGKSMVTIHNERLLEPISVRGRDHRRRDEKHKSSIAHRKRHAFWIDCVSDVELSIYNEQNLLFEGLILTKYVSEGKPSSGNSIICKF